MKKPEELIDLLSALARERHKSTVIATEDSSAVVYVRQQKMHFTPDECRLLLSDEDTVARFAEALGDSTSCNFEICDLVLNDDVLSALETNFSTVDEI